MDIVLSIQSHVVYGYVGNKASVFPLQCMGYDVCPINTVQFSNHTGYGQWGGDVFSADHILTIFDQMKELKLLERCKAVLSGYIGSAEIGVAIKKIVADLKNSQDIVYLCDPVMGDNKKCYVKPEVQSFFRDSLSADIITPNHYEAEILSGVKITDISSLKRASTALFSMGAKVVAITSVAFENNDAKRCCYASDGHSAYLMPVKQYKFSTYVNGTGDLFSSIFLGAYLKNQDFKMALRIANYYLDEVLRNTQQAKTRELQILSSKYPSVDPSKLVSLKSI